MIRFADVIQLKEGKKEEYIEKHNNIWPSIEEKMKKSNIDNFTIFYRDGLLFKYYEYLGDDFEADMKLLADDEEHERWLQYTATCQEPVPTAKAGEWWAPLEEVYRLK